MECPFQVGDEVVCVDASLSRLLSKGATYVVHSVELRIGQVFVSLDGLQEDGRRLWYPRRFRRVERPKRETNIEVFREIDRRVFGKVLA